MHPEVEELRPKLKEILYDCAVEIKATKAALYLFNGSGRFFELIAEYGFRGAIRASADFHDPLVDRCGRGRTPFYVNGLAAEPRLAEVMYEAATDRLLAAPIFLRGQLVGLIDMRDKAAKAQFEQADATKAQKIADRIGALFLNKNVFGQRFITLSETSEIDAQVTQGTADSPGARAAATATAAAPAPATQKAAPPMAAPPLAEIGPARRPTLTSTPMPTLTSTPTPTLTSTPTPALPPRTPERELAKVEVPKVTSLIIDARAAASRIVVAPTPESLTETELAAARDVLRAILLIPGATVAMLSAFGHMGGVQEIAARSSLAEEATHFLQSKLNVWLSKRGESSAFVRTSVQTPFGTTAPLTSAQLQKVFTAPVIAASMRGLYLTVAFATPPDRVAHETLALLLTQLQIAIEHSMQRTTVQSLRTRAAGKLLEPDFTKFPELRRHSEAVAARAEAFARFLTLSNAEIETIRIVGLVHDVGMRLLDYERLYRKRDISQEELSILREHVTVGAAIVEPLLGPEIARAVLCHHERVDGRGYPNELHGDDIPLASRILQICDTWVAMTDPHGYQTPQAPDNALTIIARAAGSQFDAELAARFGEFTRGRA